MKSLNEKIEEVYEEIVAIRRDLHAHPELSEQEIRTAKKISQYLREWGIPHKTAVAGCGVTASVTGLKKIRENQVYSVAALRADMDALPIDEMAEVPFRSQTQGIMHACGHDIHTAILLGSARILKAMESEFSGTVKFFFQPAEETIGGALPMIQAGCLDNPKVDAVLGLHIQPDLPCGAIQFCRGAMCAASTEFHITIRGTSCHGAHPDLGCDPIVCSAYIVTALQTAVSRSLSPTECGVITVGQIHGGAKNNIIPREVSLSGIIRSLTLEGRGFLKHQVKTIAQYTAKALGCEAFTAFQDSYPPLINSSKLQPIVEETALKQFPAGLVSFQQQPSMGTDDFSYFGQYTDAVYFNLGAKNPLDQRPQHLHNEWLNPKEDCIKAGILMEISSVLAILKTNKK